MRGAERGSERDHVAQIVLAAHIADIVLRLIAILLSLLILAMRLRGWQEGQRDKDGKDLPVFECLLHQKTFARLEERLKPFADRISPVTVDDNEEFGRPWGEAATDALIAHGNGDIWFSAAARAFAKHLYGADRLAWFQSSAAGLENPFLQKVGEKAEAYSSSHVQSEAIAEWVLWAAFDWFGSGAERRAAQEGRDWRKVPFREIGATRWIVYGFGHIGEAVGRRLKGLGAHVTGVRRSNAVSPLADRIIHPEDFSADDLAIADAVLLCCPHTPETDTMADAGFFAAMKEGSLFLNVGRGALVDEAALLKALDSGQPAHAALDVTREEPLPGDSPLWSHPGVTLTAHTSALTAESRARNDELFLENLARFLRDEPLRNLVDREAFADQSV